jgi:hypothetical protein
VTKTLTHSITCGACKGSHETPADVKACYARKAAAPVAIPSGIPGQDGTPPLSYFPSRSAALHQHEHTFSAEPVIARPAQALNPVCYDGIYTVETDERHYTFRVRTQASDADFAPGKVVVQFLSGPDNESDYTGFAFINDERKLAPWKRYRTEGSAKMVAAAEQLLADPEAALVAAHCRRCHRVLTVPASVHAGLGPECSKKGI